MLEFAQLRTEYDTHPLAVDTRSPRFSWKLRSDSRGARQSAYRVLAATDAAELRKGSADMWDSGRVESSEQCHVVYAGKSLTSNADYCWCVEVWDDEGKSAGTSALAFFSTGLFDEAEWSAQWIGRGAADEPRADTEHFPGDQAEELAKLDIDYRSPLFRREFTLDAPVKRARAYICGLGYHELHVNGAKVGDHLLSPAKTDYRKQVLYETLDLTDLLVQGANAVGIMLGNGWFNPLKEWWSWRMQWFGSPRVICQIHVELADGTTQRIVTDGDWQTSTGPIISSCIYSGETYDARIEQAGWATAGFDDSGWDRANLVAAPGGRLVSASLPPARVTDIVKPVGIREPSPGVFVFDMGQNFSGWVRLSVQGESGDEVTMRFAERAHVQGHIDVSNLSLARPTDRYILKGDGVETYQPRFTWHGFQYVSIEGYPGKPTLETIEGRFIHTDCEIAGKFTCDNDMVMRIHQCTVASQRANTQGLPVDCPQRDERLGWMGDAHVSAEEAIHNLDMATLYTKYLRDARANQAANGVIAYIVPRPGDSEDLPWTAAYFLIAWYVYLYYGDTRVFQDHRDAMERYLDYLATQAKNNIQKAALWGDHLAWHEKWQTAAGNPRSISRMNALLGRDDDALKYGKLASEIAAAYNAEYLNATIPTYDDDTETALSLPLFWKLAPEGLEPRIVDRLLERLRAHGNHVTTGLIGTKYLVDALAAAGRDDVVWTLVNQSGFPSWRYLLRDDMTTMVEHWGRGDGSYNHVVLGSVDAWFYQGLAGIRADDAAPGYAHFTIRPYVPEGLLNNVEAELETVRGAIRSAWRREGRRLVFEISIPANTSATVTLPCSGTVSESGTVIFDGQVRARVDGISDARSENGAVVFEVGAGKGGGG
jgi:alpha-L-rhamnosidase